MRAARAALRMMADPKNYAGYVDTHYLALAAELAQPDKQRACAAIRVQPGSRVLVAGREAP